MPRRNLSFGSGILARRLNGLPSMRLVTMEEPLAALLPLLDAPPSHPVLNRDASLATLEALAALPAGADWVVGVGGGTACDTAKYLSWKWGLPLILAPSALSVDAWLCRSIAVRRDRNVEYVGDVTPEEILLDFDLIRAAPAELNRAGLGDIVSIASALGDWKIGRDEFGDPFDESVFRRAQAIVEALLPRAGDALRMNDAGIRAIADGTAAEVDLCEEWGNARPEEGGEHFLAYCLEETAGGHYIHGNLIALNTLVVLKLQGERAAFPLETVKDFFDRAGVAYSPVRQGIAREDYRNALAKTPDYVQRRRLFHGVWSLPQPFADAGERSLDGILRWVYEELA